MQVPIVECEIKPEEVKSYPGIRIAPVIRKNGDNQPEIRFLWEGIADGNVEMREYKCHTVNNVQAINLGKESFLGYRGNVIREGGQNRQLAHSFILGAGSVLDVPVHCVQKGRWNPHQVQKFATNGPEMTPSSIRFYKKSQKEVWDTIYNTGSKTGTLSRSQDYAVLRDLLVGNENDRTRVASHVTDLSEEGKQSQIIARDKAQTLVKGFETPLENQIGIFIVMADPIGLEYGTLSMKYCLEIFASSDLYKKAHKEIIASFAIDVALLQERSKIEIPELNNQIFMEFIADIQKTQWQETKSIGLEKSYTIPEDSKLFGEAIVWNDRTMHCMYSASTFSSQARKPSVSSSTQNPGLTGNSSVGSAASASSSSSSSASPSSPSSSSSSKTPEFTWIDQNIGSYRIVRKLGQGSMGMIYLGQKQDGQSFAIKVNSSEHDEESKGRFLQEVNVHSLLVHPNIIRVYESGFDQERKALYFVMEYIEGENLETIVKQRGAIKPIHALKIAVAVANGLEYAWENAKIIHRDIKPGNIMIDKRTRKVKIADFGLGKSLANMNTKGVTLSGAMMGTPYYMPPEQIRNARDVSYSCDIYSLGATVYHMLTGTPPFGEQRGTLAIVRAKIYRDPIPIREINANIPEDIAEIVSKAMQREAKDRFQKYSEFIETMQKAIEKLHSETSEENMPETAKKPKTNGTADSETLNQNP